jgi:hypothetical protein
VTWEADVTTDESVDFELFLELTEDGVDRARVQRFDGRMMLVVHGPTSIPVDWLLRILREVETDLPPSPSRSRSGA